MSANSRLDDGFTLLEMLAVIVIMSVLMGIAVTGANKARENVWRTKARDVARQIVQAWNLYLLDYREFPDLGNAENGIEAKVANLADLRPKDGAKYLELSHEEEEAGRIADHWGNSLRFSLDMDYDGIMKNPAPEVYKDKAAAYSEVKASAIAWSPGKNPGNKKRWIVVWQ